MMAFMPLVVVVSAEQIQPITPHILLSDFSKSNINDAYHMDMLVGGKIIKKKNQIIFYFFRYRKEELLFPLEQLRVNQNSLMKYVFMHKNKIT